MSEFKVDFIQHNNVSKKSRARTSPEQLKHLMALYEITTLPTLQQRQQLGSRVGMTPRAVQVWFQNRRQNQKRSKSSQYTRLPSPPMSDACTLSERSSSPEPRMSIDFLCDLPPSPQKSGNDIFAAQSLLSLCHTF
jgi:hypothetical protein